MKSHLLVGTRPNGSPIVLLDNVELSNLSALQIDMKPNQTRVTLTFNYVIVSIDSRVDVDATLRNIEQLPPQVRAALRQSLT